jgi:hypothetical protein
MVKYLRMSSYIRKPFLIYDFATDPILNFLLYVENFVFFFICVVINAFSTKILAQNKSDLQQKIKTAEKPQNIKY